MSSIELKIFLVMHNFNQESFGKLVGFSRQAVNAWCRGKTKIPQKIADFCKNYNNGDIK
jgi:DNA-binding XRE family transcriptional regulator